jgi:hypothetical protein
VRELLRSNDPVLLSWVRALLADAGIEAILFDQHASIMEGSIGAIPRRLMVLAEEWDAASRVLEQAGEAFDRDAH